MTVEHTQAWPRQLRLPGQTAAAEGPVDMSAMYVMHHAFRRDLTAFAAAAQATPVDDRAAWSALWERWQLFARALHHHHSGEDAAIWPYLLERVGEEDRTTLEAMEAEHEQIDPALEQCAAGFERLAAHPDEDARAALAVRLVATREALARHLEHEETGAIPLIQRHMPPADWEAIDREQFQKGLGVRDLLRLIPWAAYGVPAADQEQVLAGNLPFRVMLWLTRRRFARREALAFAHAREQVA